jgi:predicted nucleic acid-binding protein
MNFANILAGTSIFLDANVLVYHLTSHAQLGQTCTDLVKRIEQGIIHGCTSTHIMSEVSHRLMLIEASQTFGWPLAGTLNRLKKHPQEISKLVRFPSVLQQIPKLGITILTISPHLIDAAAQVSLQNNLFSNDALIIAVMQAHGLTNLASHDQGFDAVPGIARYAPI